MSFNSRTEEYYKKFIELQEKLRKSEEERLKLEIKFNEMLQVTREEEQMHYRKLRSQYKRFLEEDRRRQDRNERILRTLERIDNRVAMIVAKTERFKLLRQQYQTFLDRVYKVNQLKKTESVNVPQENKHEKLQPVEKESDIVESYIQNLSSQKLRDMLKKEESSRNRLLLSTSTDPQEDPKNEDFYLLGHNESRPNYASSIADDIMNSIYSKHKINSDPRQYQPKETNNIFNSQHFGQMSDFERQPNFDQNRPLYQDEFNSALPKDYYQEDAIIKPSEESDTDLSEASVYYKKSSLDAKGSNNNFNGVEKINEYIPLKRDENIVHKQSQDFPTSTELAQKREFEIQNYGTANTTIDKIQQKVQVNENLPKDSSVTEQHLINEAQESSYSDLQRNEIPRRISEDQSLKITQPVKLDPSKIAEEITKPEIRNESKQSDSHLLKNIVEGTLPKLQKQNEYIEQNIQSAQPTDNKRMNIDYHQQPLSQSPENKELISQDQPVINQESSEESPDVREHLYENEQPAGNQDDNIISNLNETIPQLNEDKDAVLYDQSEQPQPEEIYQQYDQSGQEYDQNQLIQQYDESGQPINIQQYDEQGQFIQQYDENGQPIQQYDEAGQLLQQYDQAGQPIQQYDETGQPISQSFQQYDGNGQPFPQYDENGQLLQQYDQSGRPIQQYDENGQPLQQYDENGQPFAQYDENGQLLGQYDENGQLLQQYDGQYFEQYDESGQLIPQYDENGQLLQQYNENEQPLQYDENGQVIQQYGEVVPNYDEQGAPLQTVRDDQQFYQEPHEEKTEEKSNGPVNAQLPVTEQEPLEKPSADLPEEVKKSSNVMEMLDTDTESAKQDTKVSNDSDFDFSNG